MTYHIMIVEDDPMVRELNAEYVRRIIKPGELAVTECGNAADALATIKKATPDLILLDVYMPTMSGSEMLAHLTQMNVHPQIIMLTAASDLDHVREALDYGVLDYLVKPFSFARFNTAIQRFLTFKTVTQAGDTFSQHDLDQLFTTDALNAKPQELPKGLSNFTLTNIQQVIKQLPAPFSNQDVANAAKLSRISTKKYLDYLLAQDELTASVKYLKVGRPTTIYRVNS